MIEMANAADEISSVSDVSYLITQLRVAKRKNMTDMVKAIVSRLQEIGVLREGQATEHASFKSLRGEVTKILGSHDS
jgi:hypothetical protein